MVSPLHNFVARVNVSFHGFIIMEFHNDGLIEALCSTPAAGVLASIDRRDALRPDAYQAAAAHGAGQKRRVLHAAAPEPRAARPFADEHGEEPPFDVPCAPRHPHSCEYFE
jgi:hypothetical protein